LIETLEPVLKPVLLRTAANPARFCAAQLKFVYRLTINPDIANLSRLMEK